MPIEVINAEVTLEKFSGKGGWTYAPVSAPFAGSKGYFSTLPVSGKV